MALCGVREWLGWWVGGVVRCVGRGEGRWLGVA